MIIKQEIDRNRMLRTKSNEGKKGADLMLEREVKNMLSSGRKVFWLIHLFLHKIS